LGIKAGKTPNFLMKNEGSEITPEQYVELQTHHATSLANASAEVQTASNLTLIMGYGANYAIWVHEMPESYHWSERKNSPSPGPKWFEKSLKRNRKAMEMYIGESARITQIKGFAATRTSAANTETEEV
jgi:hypothetical protein